ncbi:AmmeMemoRadiSam system protein A [Candidatus Woesearchaeota archaeon]|nr:AmmeMemoRadiSam system protein A [Candidatus Woesearchaeota archaeon]
MLTAKDRQELIKLAKEAVKSYLDKKPYQVPEAIKKKYSDKRGVFVCIKKGKYLQGCIGYIEPEHPLWWAVVNAAKGAAFEDPRFPATSKQELPEITFEISVLTEPKLLECKPEERPSKIQIGKHGLIAEKEQYKGILLPQVFPEFNSDAESALNMTCEKAGLPSRAWESPETKIYTFECQVFKK